MFKPYGQSGIEVSEIFAKTARHVDDLCFIRSMHGNTPNHEQSMRLMNCGDERLSRPSYGAWVTYGMGSENENLPGYIAMCPGLPVADVSNWRSACLPGIYQGTHINTKKTKPDELIENITNGRLSLTAQRRQLNLLAEFNAEHQRARRPQPRHDGGVRIRHTGEGGAGGLLRKTARNLCNPRLNVSASASRIEPICPYASLDQYPILTPARRTIEG